MATVGVIASWQASRAPGSGAICCAWTSRTASCASGAMRASSGSRRFAPGSTSPGAWCWAIWWQARRAGTGELRPLPGSWPRAAEVAISVEPAFQGQGVGRALLRRLTLTTRNRWIRRLHMLCLLDTGRMVRLARRLESRLSFADGQVEASLELPWPTGWTLLEEIAGELCGFWATPPGDAWPACGARWHRARACADGSSAA